MQIQSQCKFNHTTSSCLGHTKVIQLSKHPENEEDFLDTPFQVWNPWPLTQRIAIKGIGTSSTSSTINDYRSPSKRGGVALLIVVTATVQFCEAYDLARPC
jgi:hypothetical protein